VCPTSDRPGAPFSFAGPKRRNAPDRVSSAAADLRVRFAGHYDLSTSRRCRGSMQISPRVITPSQRRHQCAVPLVRSAPRPYWHDRVELGGNRGDAVPTRHGSGARPVRSQQDLWASLWLGRPRRRSTSSAIRVPCLRHRRAFSSLRRNPWPAARGDPADRASRSALVHSGPHIIPMTR